MKYRKNSEYSKESLEKQTGSKIEITSEKDFLNRREFLKNTSQVASTSVLFGFAANPIFKEADLLGKVTAEKNALSYNNFYEFSLDKEEVKSKVEKWNLDVQQWKVQVEGLCEKTGSYSIDELVKMSGGSQEERVYRFRCVEGWSMVLPWGGFELAKLINTLKPKSKAKYIYFQSFKDSKVAPNIENLNYPWPYQEGLLLEEALNPLAFIATGLYGKPLPKQSGAPLRLVVPWKYGFKSIKSIVKIGFTDNQPKTLWNELAPKEYGFFANVNPKVDHPRWSQATERVIDGKLFPTRQPTLMFNGYEKQVASLYQGLDLSKNY